MPMTVSASRISASTASSRLGAQASAGTRRPASAGTAAARHALAAVFSSSGRSVRARTASTVISPERLIPGGASGSTRMAITLTSGPK